VRSAAQEAASGYGAADTAEERQSLPRCPTGAAECVFVLVSLRFMSDPWRPVRVATTQSVRQSVRRWTAQAATNATHERSPRLGYRRVVVVRPHRDVTDGADDCRGEFIALPIVLSTTGTRREAARPRTAQRYVAFSFAVDRRRWPTSGGWRYRRVLAIPPAMTATSGWPGCFEIVALARPKRTVNRGHSKHVVL
jgi:hypothetical protein